MNKIPGIHPKFIGFDIDGVVADTMEAFIRMARMKYGVHILPEEITEFRVEECLPMKIEQVEDILTHLLEEPLESGLMPMANAPEVLMEFSRLAPLTFITARPRKEPVVRWLKKVLGDAVVREARLIAMGDHDGKADYIKDLGLQYFVDDRFETCQALAEKDITPIVYNQPWNRGRHSFQAVDDWLSIRSLCL